MFVVVIRSENMPQSQITTSAIGPVNGIRAEQIKGEAWASGLHATTVILHEQNAAESVILSMAMEQSNA